MRVEEKEVEDVLRGERVSRGGAYKRERKTKNKIKEKEEGKGGTGVEERKGGRKKKRGRRERRRRGDPRNLMPIRPSNLSRSISNFDITFYSTPETTGWSLMKISMVGFS